MHHAKCAHGGGGGQWSVRQCVSSSVRQFVILSAMELGSAGRHYLRPNIVCVRVLSGLVCCAGRRMDLIPRAEHRVGRMRLSMKLAHLGRGGNFAGFGGADFLAVAVFLVGEKKRSDTSYVRPKSDSGRECSCSSGRRSELLSSLEASLKLIGCTHSKSSLFALASVVVFVFVFFLSLLFFKA